MHLGLTLRATVASVALGEVVFLLAVGTGPSFSGEIQTVGANVSTPTPFSHWGPEVEKIYKEENGHADYSAEIHYDLGLYFYEQGEYDLSLEHYRKATEIDPDFPEAYFGIGLLFYTLGDDDNAVRYYLRSLEKNPRDADTRNNLGLIYYRQGELASARTQIEEAIRLQPEFPDAFYNLGLVLYQQAELKDAVHHFLEALNQDPSYLRARFNLGVVYYELGLGDLAEEQWLAIQEQAPGSSLAVQAAQNLSVLATDTP